MYFIAFLQIVSVFCVQTVKPQTRLADIGTSFLQHAVERRDLYLVVLSTDSNLLSGLLSFVPCHSTELLLCPHSQVSHTSEPFCVGLLLLLVFPTATLTESFLVELIESDIDSHEQSEKVVAHVTAQPNRDALARQHGWFEGSGFKASSYFVDVAFLIFVGFDADFTVAAQQ